MTNTLKEGDRFYYTGDMANGSSFGTITEVLQPTKYSHLRYRVTFDTIRFEGDTKESIVEYFSFNKGIGQRFKTMDQYNEEIQNKFEQYYKQQMELPEM